MTVVKIMKKVKAWMQRHHSTISSFLSNFTATVLGIVITFGTTSWYNQRQKSQAADLLAEQCLSNMEERLEDLDKVVEFYDQHVRWFSLLDEAVLDSLTDEELEESLYTITYQKYLVTNHAYEKSFAQSSASLESLGRFSQVIGVGFENLVYAEDNHAAINNLKHEMTQNQILSNNTFYVKNNILEVVKTMISDPNYQLFCTEYMQHEQSVRRMHGYLKFFIPAARSLWNKEMTDDEFWAEAKNKWNGQ